VSITSRTRGSHLLFLSVLVFSPLAFGTVEEWSLTLMEGLSVFALLLFLFEKPSEDGFDIKKVPGAIPLLCLSLYFAVQLVPLPAALVRVLSPGTYRAYMEGIGITEPVGWITLSLQKKATLREFFRFTGYFAFYVVTVQLLSRKEFLRKTVNVIIIFSFLFAFEAMLQKILGNDRIFWIRKLTGGGTPFGSFVNRNHYAGLMEMVFPVVLAVFLYYKPRVGYGTIRERLSELLQRKETNFYILAGFAALLISISVFLTLSRSGIVVLCLSMVFFGASLAAMKRSRKRGMIIAGLFSLLVVSVAWFGWGPIFQRFSMLADAGMDLDYVRPQIWKDSLGMFRDFPLTGTGFGSFFAVYPKYRTWTGPGFADHAHNDYLELITDGGATAFLLVGWFLLVLFAKAYGRFRLRKDPYSVYLFLGSLTGMMALLMHSFTDFNMHIGSNGLYFFFLAGLLVSAANTRLRNEVRPHTYLGSLSSRWVTAFRIFFLFVFLSGVIFNSGVLLASFFYSRGKEVRLDASTDERSLRAVGQFSRKASVVDPYEPLYYSTAGNTEMLLRHPDAAVADYVKAVRLEPVNGEYLQRLGLAYSAIGDYDRSARLLRAGLSAGGKNPFLYRTYASWLISHGEREAGILNMRQAISLDPDRTRDYITMLVICGLSDSEIAGVLPGMTGPHIIFADYLRRTGNEELAAGEYRKALGFETTNPSYFLQAYGYYMNRHDYDSAMSVMRKAVEALPDNAGLRIAAGDAYERAGIKYRAVEEYRRALMIDPGNTGAAAKLKELDAGG
jgi:O-antigen ligase/tetratricopeptide (TPR) repeat protein